PRVPRGHRRPRAHCRTAAPVRGGPARDPQRSRAARGVGARADGARGRGPVVNRKPTARDGAGDILVVGSVAFDSIETPFGKAVEALGGSASYFSVSASHFAPVKLVAVVGEDFPAEHRAMFERRGVDLSGLETAPGRTFRWRGEYGAELGHAHTLETQLNVFASFHPRLDDHHRRT